MVLASATGFGTLAILAKLGYAVGLTLIPLLAYRFVVAALAMVALAAALRQNPLRAGGLRPVVALFAMGALGYAGQAFTFFTALRTLSASLTELILYTYPTLVALAGWLIFRRRLRRIHLLALPLSFAGVTLLVGGVGLQFGAGLAFAFAAPLIYTAYILVGDRVMPGMPAVGSSAVTITGAACVFVAVALVSGQVHAPSSWRAWAIVAALALLPTMLAITLFLAALPRIGAANASLLSTWEPVVTVVLAAGLLGERLAAIQLLGAGLVLLAVVAVQWPPREDASSEKMTRERLGEPLPRRGEE